MKVLFEFICWLILLAMMICIATVHADPLKVAVIDTGLDLTDPRLSPHLCLTGHADTTGDGIKDTHGHGTHVVGLIEKYAKDSDYCLVILKFYGKKGEQNGVADSGFALREAINQHVDIINLSLSGDTGSEAEKNLICGHPEIKFIVAAGNQGFDLDVTKSYPASYACNNMIVVGAIQHGKEHYSNHGKVVNVLEEGSNIESTLPDGAYGRMTGTSMATAIHTGKYIYESTHKHP